MAPLYALVATFSRLASVCCLLLHLTYLRCVVLLVAPSYASPAYASPSYASRACLSFLPHPVAGHINQSESSSLTIEYFEPGTELKNLQETVDYLQDKVL